MKLLIACLAVAILWQSSPAHAIGEITPMTSQERATLHQEDVLSQAGEDALRAGNYLDAEKNFRGINSLDRWDAEAYRGVAEALAGQGRYGEAVHVYQALIYQDPFKWSSVVAETRVQMGYAAALGQAGRWSEAVAVYEKALPDVPQVGPSINIHFDPRVPMPALLQSIAHIACGMQYTGNGENKAAFQAFAKAVQAAPDSDLANFCYGYGWQRLDPKDKAKALNEEQARAAFAKAAKLGKGEVKKAAQKALLVVMKSK